MAIPGGKVQAGNKGVLLGVLGGVVIGAAINNQRNKNKQAQQPARRTGISSAQREQNREVQRSLNYFQYPVGTVDGSLGPNSRRAIRNFETDMGFQADGYLDDYERNFLTGSYQRTQGGVYGQDSQILAQQGTRGLLRSYRNQQQQAYNQNGQDYNNPTQPVQNYGNQTQQQTPNYNNQTQQQVPNYNTADGQSQVGQVASAPALPSFMPTAPVRSMEQHCQSTHMLTVTNGGLMDASNITNPAQALNEQFCLAQQYTTAEGKSKAATIGGVTSEQIQAQCQSLTDILSEAIEATPNQPVNAVLATVTQTIIAAGGTPATLAPTSQICLSVGYQVDKPKMAAAAALLLVAAGQTPYGEIIGHQLREGFGFTASPERAKEWYTMALDAMAAGAAPTILPSQAAARNAVIRTAIGQGTSQASLIPNGNVSGSASVTNASIIQPLPIQ